MDEENLDRDTRERGRGYLIVDLSKLVEAVDESFSCSVLYTRESSLQGNSIFFFFFVRFRFLFRAIDSLDSSIVRFRKYLQFNF